MTVEFPIPTTCMKMEGKTCWICTCTEVARRYAGRGDVDRNRNVVDAILKPIGGCGGLCVGTSHA